MGPPLRRLCLHRLFFHQVPGFPVFCVSGTLVVWRQEDVGVAFYLRDREDVPGIGGDYVGRDEVDLVGRVGHAV